MKYFSSISANELSVQHHPAGDLSLLARAATEPQAQLEGGPVAGGVSTFVFVFIFVFVFTIVFEFCIYICICIFSRWWSEAEEDSAEEACNLPDLEQQQS